MGEVKELSEKDLWCHPSFPTKISASNKEKKLLLKKEVFSIKISTEPIYSEDEESIII